MKVQNQRRVIFMTHIKNLFKQKKEKTTMKEMTLKEIQKILGYEVKVVAEKLPKKYKKTGVGETTEIADVEWIVLNNFDDGSVLCMTKDFVYRGMQFDSNTPNYANSSVRKMLNDEFLKKIVDEVGEDGILATEIDLTSVDGLDDFGKVTDKVGLLTFDMYREYNRMIEKYPIESSWWLATPWSTPHRGWHSTVCRVYGDGAVCDGCCRYGDGVRPFCIFSSSIFES